MHKFVARPRRIAYCLEGANLATAQSEWDAIDKTPERQQMRRQRKLAQQRQAPSREDDSTRRVVGWPCVIRLLRAGVCVTGLASPRVRYPLFPQHFLISIFPLSFYSFTVYVGARVSDSQIADGRSWREHAIGMHL